MASGRSRRSCSSSRAGSSIGSSVRFQRPPCRAYWTRKPDTAHRRMRTMSVSVQIRRSPGPAEAVGIRGYPSALEQVVTLRNGASVRLRPIRPDDQPRLMALCRRLSPRTVYERFFSFRRLVPQEAHAFANVDYRQRMGSVAVRTPPSKPRDREAHSMRIAVLGSGGIGGYYGALLAKAGHDIVFIARGAHLEAMQRRGLTMRTPAGESTVPVTAVADTRTVEPVDVVLFCVKSYDTEPAAHSLEPLMARNTAGR